MTPIYLDNAATTPMLPEIALEMRRIQVEDFGNPSSTHSYGERPRRLLDARVFFPIATAFNRLDQEGAIWPVL